MIIDNKKNIEQFKKEVDELDFALRQKINYTRRNNYENKL